MTIQTVPAYLQNASHSAAVFRQAISAAWSSGGVVAAGEMAVGAQTSPNMSVRVGAGRAIVPGSQVTAPTLLSGATGTFTTQGMYQVFNDATATVTIAASDPTNPRIDTVYTAVNDAFYSGALNTAALGVVTGTPAASPVAPAAPSNSVVLGYVAVAANATSIVSGNVTTANVLASVDGTAYAMAQNSLTMTLSGAATTVSSITFPTGRFLTAPNVYPAMQSSPGLARKFNVQATGASTTGAQLTLSTGDGTNGGTSVVVGWFAIQLLPGATNG